MRRSNFWAGSNKPSERGAFIIKVGLMLYDAFTRKLRALSRRTASRAKTASHKRFPQLHPEARYTATYYDGSILSPERYTVELILDAEAEGPHARALNYVSLTGVEGENVILKDELTGETYQDQPDSTHQRRWPLD